MATRIQKQAGATYLKQVDRIQIVSNPHIRDINYLASILMRILLCGDTFSPD